MKGSYVPIIRCLGCAPTSPGLATDGPLRYARNLGYLFLAMLYAGRAVFRNAPGAILLLAVLFAIQHEAIGREERYLERTFGEEYLSYKARVRRWV